MYDRSWIILNFPGSDLETIPYGNETIGENGGSENGPAIGSSDC